MSVEKCLCAIKVYKISYKYEKPLENSHKHQAITAAIWTFNSNKLDMQNIQSRSFYLLTFHSVMKRLKLHYRFN